MTDRQSHGCAIRTDHHPVPHAIERHHQIPRGWQRQLYGGEVRLVETIPLCPTHHRHAHLALDAAVGQVVFGLRSPFDRRQFGPELWNWAEDAAVWLRERLRHWDGVPEQFNWNSGVKAWYETE